MAQQVYVLFTTLLVVIAAHNSFYSTKTHVMAHDEVLPMAMKLFQGIEDPTCDKPCNTMADCADGWFCQACWNFKKTCGPFVRDAIAMDV